MMGLGGELGVTDENGVVKTTVIGVTKDRGKIEDVGEEFGFRHFQDSLDFEVVGVDGVAHFILSFSMESAIEKASDAIHA